MGTSMIALDGWNGSKRHEGKSSVAEEQVEYSVRVVPLEGNTPFSQTPPTHLASHCYVRHCQIVLGLACMNGRTPFPNQHKCSRFEKRPMSKQDIARSLLSKLGDK